jgi:hypothetical protein
MAHDPPSHGINWDIMGFYGRQWKYMVVSWDLSVKSGASSPDLNHAKTKYPETKSK